MEKLMDIPGIVAGALGGGGIALVAKQAQDFIAAIAGHPGESIGTMLGNIGNRRVENLEAVGSKAHLTLLNIGVTAAEVPLNVLQPVLEAASLQDDDSLRSTWANILANAADPRHDTPVYPSFAGILKELTTNEVKFLSQLFSELNGVWSTYLTEAALRQTYASALGIELIQYGEFDDFQMSLDVLERNRLLAQHPIAPTIDGRAIRQEALSTRYEPDFIQVGEIDSSYSLTRLGYLFVRACESPKP